MGAVYFWDSILIAPPREKIFRRMGFKRGKTQISVAQTREIEDYIDDALFDIQLKGAGKRISIAERLDVKTVLATGQTLDSAQVTALLANSGEIFLMGASAGSRIMEAIRQDSAHNRLTRAVVLDAVASEMTDEALEWITRYLNHELLRERKQLTKRRFSAGYGDFGLENQAWIYRTLELERLGISLTDSCMLVPEKSVTAVAGIEDLK